MQEQMIALIERHCQTIKQEAVEIDRSLGRLGSSSKEENIDQARYLVHKIKGSSGTLGFLALSQSAQALEDALRVEISALDTAQIRNLNGVMQGQISGMAPQKSILFDRFSRVST